MAVSTLARQGEDKYTRQAYQRRKDEIYYYNKNMSEWEKDKRKLAEQDAVIADKDAENEKLKRQLAELRSQLAKR